MNGCHLCPRNCGADRAAGEYGICGGSETMTVCRAALHFGEEPCLSGSRGSGTIFFSGCPLHCVYCQNAKISGRNPGDTLPGRRVTPLRLREMFWQLIEQGAHNINLVTPSHFASPILAALRSRLPQEPPSNSSENPTGLPVPVVWNGSGYESLSTLRALDGRIQIYLPDLKYADPALGQRYSQPEIADYPERAKAAILAMVRQCGPYQLDQDGLLRSGVLIRHMILPGAPENTRAVIDWVRDTFPPHTVLFSLMGQYTPMPGVGANFPELAHPLSDQEYQQAEDYLFAAGIEDGFVQEPDASGENFIPDFDL